MDPLEEGKRTAFVLAGGGAKGAFEAGAIRYLIEERGAIPQVITAASAGSIVALVLAQARTPHEFRARAAELRTDLLAMTDNERLFGRQPWVRQLDGTVLAPLITGAITERTRPPVPGEPGREASEPPPAAGTDEGSFRLPAQVSAGLSRLSIGVGFLRALPGLSRARRTFRDGARSMMTLDPLDRALHRGADGIARVDPELIARPGLELRMAVVALSAGVLRYVTGQGVLVGDDARTPVEGEGCGPVDVIEGALASSSVPMIFPPRPLADDVYVDGGVLENIPVAAAGALGAEEIIAVLAVPLALPEDRRDFASLNMAGVLLRSMVEIEFADRQRRSLACALPDGTKLTVIDPLVDLVGPFEVSLGLMVIDMDYGWMRAADVLAEDDPARREVADRTTEAVVIARARAWYGEERLWALGSATPEEMVSLRELKSAVADAVAERKGLGLALPEDAHTWASSFELHASPAPPGIAAEDLA